MPRATGGGATDVGIPTAPAGPGDATSRRQASAVSTRTGTGSQRVSATGRNRGHTSPSTEIHDPRSGAAKRHPKTAQNPLSRSQKGCVSRRSGFNRKLSSTSQTRKAPAGPPPSAHRSSPPGGDLPEQWPGTVKSTSRVDTPFYETTQHVRPRAAPCYRFLPHRHVGERHERHERHDKSPCRWHFRLAVIARDQGVDALDHASLDEITDAQPGSGDPRWDYLTDLGLNGAVENLAETGETGGTDRLLPTPCTAQR